MKDEGTERALKEMVELMFLKPGERGIFGIKEEVAKGENESWKEYFEKTRSTGFDLSYTRAHAYGFYAGIKWALGRDGEE